MVITTNLRTHEPRKPALLWLGNYESRVEQKKLSLYENDPKKHNGYRVVINMGLKGKKQNLLHTYRFAHLSASILLLRYKILG